MSEENEHRAGGMSALTAGLMRSIADEEGAPTITVIDVGQSFARLADLLGGEPIDLSAASVHDDNSFESDPKSSDGK